MRISHGGWGGWGGYLYRNLAPTLMGNWNICIYRAVHRYSHRGLTLLLGLPSSRWVPRAGQNPLDGHITPPPPAAGGGEAVCLELVGDLPEAKPARFKITDSRQDGRIVAGLVNLFAHFAIPPYFCVSINKIILVLSIELV